MRRRHSLAWSLLLPALSLVPVVLAALPLTEATARAETLNVVIPIEKYQLENGLEVILSEDHRTPVVTTNIWYHVGSKDEPKGKNGFAHLFEHVMFQGSRHVAEDTFFKQLERAGSSQVNGTTNLDRTNYFETVPANQIELPLWLESDRMAFLLDHADDATFKSQREVVKNERRQSYENAPYGLVYQFAMAALYPEGHPYHLLTIGTPEDLDAASLEDVRAFFRTYYVPNNATLVLAGDFDKTKAKELIAKYFAPIVRGADPAVRKQPMPVELSGEKRLAVQAEVELPRIYIAWPTPPGFAAGDAELDIVSSVLSSGKSSRLYKRLVYDLQIAQDVSANQGSAKLSSTYMITVTLKKGKSTDEALAIVDDELAKLRSVSPAAAEVDRARTQILSHTVFGAERVADRANLLNEYNQQAGDPDYLEKDIQRYSAVKPDSVKDAVSRYLPEKKRVVVVVTPTPGAPRAGRLVEGSK